MAFHLPFDALSDDRLTLLLQWLAGLSLLMFIGGLLLVPWMIIRLPTDYFLHSQPGRRQRTVGHPVLRLLLLFIRTLLGLGLVAGGAIMLVLPGQGILTILIGISILEFPGKHWLRNRLLQIKQVRRALNWIREKGDQPPFLFEQ